MHGIPVTPLMWRYGKKSPSDLQGRTVIFCLRWQASVTTADTDVFRVIVAVRQLFADASRRTT
jgi:hypothetical protein